ncbi:PAS domain-containing protein [Sphingomonas aracearum]|uniref:PAS fold-4 domain-containing protein n=1 Tax=Sphingomonas aracearum TaxID=2283317 RepID=A0A369VSY1_9SPHN|nr:PAS domain-containing protein [Sphingomonas aracearum]RDE05123.1 hypothetical protein DVW87_07510 [Sphingomonas aracearum]
MNAPTRIARLEPGRDQVVTSSDLVRHFGIWQDRAARSPVYVLQRGRPRFVLTTIDVMEALCAPSGEEAGTSADIDGTLVDGVSDLVVVADGSLRVSFANQAARAYFGEAAAVGANVAGLSSSSAGTILAEAVRRVAGTGVAESLELPSPTYPCRTLMVAIAPHGGGVTLTARDATLAADLAEARAVDDARRQALEAMRDMAVARINLRGYLEAPDSLLEALTGLSGEALASVRFVSLLDISARALTGDAIEAVIASGEPQVVNARLLVNRSAPVPVRIGLAALRLNGAVRGVTALIARASA